MSEESDEPQETEITPEGDIELPLDDPGDGGGDDPNVVAISIIDEIKQSYLSYSMSVIIGRALPDVRDGLKPVHRRILYAMHKLGNRYTAPHKKSARIVGDVIGQYHPHGDTAVYDALVRLAQDFNMRVPLVEGQGNFGSIDGDPAAAMRYTEVRMTKVTEEFLSDIDKDTVNWQLTFDSSQNEPMVLPTKVPNLLVNGSSGIAVGMSTNIPPHNLTEAINATIALIDDPEISIEGLMRHMPGPDFPTAGFIYGASPIRQAYETGRGVIRTRARAHIEEDKKSGKSSIIITELPYQVNKAKLVAKINQLIRDKKLDGPLLTGTHGTNPNDESSGDGIRIVIELRSDAVPQVVLNNLYNMTRMQSSFGIIMLAIVNGQPQQMNLKEILNHFIDFRRDVTTRRTIFELEKAEARAHILEGLVIALDNLDAVIKLIRASINPQEAEDGLIERFGLTQIQAKAVLAMRLQTLTGMERDKIINELEEIRKQIEYLRGLLSDESKMMALIKTELLEVRDKHGDERRTEIVYDADDIGIEDLIPEEQMAVTISNHGYIKRTPISTYRSQRRGGQGRRGMKTKAEDFVRDVFVSSTHAELLAFSSIGKVYKIRVFSLPEGSPTNQGTHLANLLPLQKAVPAEFDDQGNLVDGTGLPEEAVRAVVAVDDFEADKYIVSCTKNGIVKRTHVSAYQNVHSGGIRGLSLKDENDDVVSVQLTEKGDQLLLVSATGQSIRFDLEDVRASGRTATGVFGMRFKDPDDRVVSMDVIPHTGYDHLKILTITKNGYGKRTEIDEHSLQGRGGTGMIVIKTTERNGPVVASRLVADDDEILLITNDAQIVRTAVREISVFSRNTQGVSVMKTKDNDSLVGIARIRAEDLDQDEEDEDTEQSEQEGGDSNLVEEAAIGEEDSPKHDSGDSNQPTGGHDTESQPSDSSDESAE